MDPVTLLKAAILGIVEGLTEFLPVSSTGHLILAEDLLRFSGEGREVFIVAIQSGAILAVIWEYRARLARLARGLGREPREQRLALNVVVAFLPAAVLGVLLKDTIEAALFHPLPVALALIAGGLVILVVEHLHARREYRPRVDTMDDMDWRDALKIGCAQCFALIPGTSRSGATIIGGLVFGLSRPAATEFSFFLALPTVIGASVYSLWQARDELSLALVPSFLVGSATAFVSALLCVRWLLRFVSRNDFRVFAWYRIAFGGVVLLTGWAGWVDWRT